MIFYSGYLVAVQWVIQDPISIPNKKFATSSVLVLIPIVHSQYSDLSDLPEPDPEAEIELLEDIEDKHPECGLTNSSILSESDPSDPCCSNSSGSNSRSSSSASGGSGNQSSSSTSSDDNSSWETIFLQNKNISGSPSRSLLMQKFLSQLRKNPNDSQLQSFFQLLLAGPEFSPPRQRLRHVTHMSDVMRLFRWELTSFHCDW